MEPLPFEEDTLSFLLYCAQAIAPAPEAPRWQESGQRGAVSLPAFSEPIPFEPQEESMTVITHTSAIDPEAISRAFQRDARRYD